MDRLSIPKGPFTLRNATVPLAALRGEAPSGRTGLLDLKIEDGKVARVAPAAPGPMGLNEVDCDKGLVLPAFVDLHTHLDKGHIWPRKSNPDGTWLSALIAVGEDRFANWSARDVERRMDFSLRCAYAHGTAAIRTHLDSVPPQHDITWELFEAMRERWHGRIELQAVALIGPDQLLDEPAVHAVARQAKASGGVMGGSVAVHPQAREAVLRAVEIAGEYGLALDMHIDETGDASSSALRYLADAVIETGFEGQVVAGHCCVIAVQDDIVAQGTIDRVAEAGIAIVSLPMCNMYLQDRHNAQGLRTPRWRGTTLLNELKAAGVPVAVASDNTRDPFYAYGDLDGFEVLREAARILHFDHPQSDAFAWVRAISGDPARIVGFAYRGEIAIGTPADLILFSARTWTELMARPQTDRLVLRQGRPIEARLPDFRELDDLMETH